MKIWCSNLVSFLNGSFQNGVSFPNENGFENEIKTWSRQHLRDVLKVLMGSLDDSFEGFRCMGLSSNDFGTEEEYWFVRFKKWFLVDKAVWVEKAWSLGLGLHQSGLLKTF